MLTVSTAANSIEFYLSSSSSSTYFSKSEFKFEFSNSGFPKLSCATGPSLRIKFTAEPTFKLR